MSNGKLSLKLTAPGIGNDGQPNTGSVDIAVNLGTLTPGDQTCLSSSPISATAGILSPWFGNTAPNARATFGIYKTPVIYMRESF
jgi:MSHA biogenesis protein MshQ